MTFYSGKGRIRIRKMIPNPRQTPTMRRITQLTIRMGKHRTILMI